MNWKKIESKIFPFPFWIAVLSFLLCAAALIWVFVNGKENHVLAYGLYALSAYTLTAVCVKLPDSVKQTRAWLQRHPKLLSALKDSELKFKAELYFEQLLNFAYGIFKIASGVILGSAWIGCDGIYNMVQAMIQLFQILRRRKPGTLQAQWKSYRFCGFLILLMHLSLTGIVFQMINWNRA